MEYKMKKILITCRLPEQSISKLYQYFYVTYPENIQLKYNEVTDIIKDYEIILAAGIRIDKNMIDKAAKLEYISNFGVGYDAIDVEYASAKKIVISNTPASVTESTAELAFGLMLAVARRISECDRKLRADRNLRWGLMQNLGSRLHGKTLGIFGLGRIGSSVARRAFASGMKVYYYNRNKLDQETENKLSVSYMGKEELLKISDYISISIPLSKDTFHFFGKKEFEMTKPGVFLINTSRGAIIDEKAMISYLKSGHIAGAGLDVFENEPKIPEEFFSMDNVVMTPHIGTASIESRIDIGLECTENIIDYFINKKPVNIINPDALLTR
jgi:glyoxylate reductase